MPKKEVLEMCEIAIKNDLGSLDDIPYELANTIANVYYKFYSEKFDIMKRSANNPGWLPKQVKRASDMRDGFKSFIEDSVRIMSDYEAAPKSIQILREINKISQPMDYKYMLDFILDNLKYHIKDAHNKTGLRRMIERKFITANEIPNLIGLLDV